MRRKELWQKFPAGQDTGHKQYKYLYRQMLDEGIVRKAYKKLRKGKTKRKEIIYIDAHLDKEVAAMIEMIRNTKPPDVKVEKPELAFRPRKHTPRYIREHGKTRKILMPEIHEQWLHHIIVLILEPIITATAYKFSCGSFPKRGAHYGKRQMEHWIRSGKGIRNFGKIDIRHFYDSIRMDVLMKELSIRIKDTWFLYMIRLCFQNVKKGLPLGFYLSQWLANYLLEPLDRFITEKLGIREYERYMDDMTFFDNSKKKLHQAIAAIRQFIGRRFRLKLKRNYQVCKFDFVKKSGQTIGRPIDFMGFVFFRTRTVIRESIMLSASRLAVKTHKAKDAGRGYYQKDIHAMVSYIGWFDCTDTYGCYEKYIKQFVIFGKLKKIISKLQRRQNKHERLDSGAMLRTA